VDIWNFIRKENNWWKGPWLIPEMPRADQVMDEDHDSPETKIDVKNEKEITVQELSSYSVDQAAQWLESIGLTDLAAFSKNKQINGRKLIQLEASLLAMFPRSTRMQFLDAMSVLTSSVYFDGRRPVLIDVDPKYNEQSASTSSPPIFASDSSQSVSSSTPTSTTSNSTPKQYKFISSNPASTPSPQSVSRTSPKSNPKPNYIIPKISPNATSKSIVASSQSPTPSLPTKNEVRNNNNNNNQGSNTLNSSPVNAPTNPLPFSQAKATNQTVHQTVKLANQTVKTNSSPAPHIIPGTSKPNPNISFVTVPSISASSSSSSSTSTLLPVNPDMANSGGKFPSVIKLNSTSNATPANSLNYTSKKTPATSPALSNNSNNSGSKATSSVKNSIDYSLFDLTPDDAKSASKIAGSKTGDSPLTASKGIIANVPIPPLAPLKFTFPIAKNGITKSSVLDSNPTTSNKSAPKLPFEPFGSSSEIELENEKLRQELNEKRKIREAKEAHVRRLKDILNQLEAKKS